MMLAKLREKLRLAWIGLLLKLIGVSLHPARPKYKNMQLTSDDIADLRTVEPDPDMYASGFYRLPSGTMQLQLTNEIVTENGLDYRLADVHGDTLYPLDGAEPPRKLLVRPRLTKTDFRDERFAAVLFHRAVGGLIPVGVFVLIRDPAR